MQNDTESTTNNPVGLGYGNARSWWTGLPAGYIEPAVNFMIFIRCMLVLGWRPGRLVLYWYPVYADERQRQTNKSAPCRAIRRPLMRARRCELKPRAGRCTVRGARRGAYPKTPRQNTGFVSHCWKLVWIVFGNVLSTMITRWQHILVQWSLDGSTYLCSDH